MKKTQSGQNGTLQPDSTRPMTSQKNQILKPETLRKKSWWARYVARLKKHEGDVRSCCR